LRKILTASIGIAGLAALSLAFPAIAQSALESLRGPVPLTDTAPAPDISSRR
jgi:hypothetical protein